MLLAGAEAGGSGGHGGPFEAPGMGVDTGRGAGVGMDLQLLRAGLLPDARQPVGAGVDGVGGHGGPFKAAAPEGKLGHARKPSQKALSAEETEALVALAAEVEEG